MDTNNNNMQCILHDERFMLFNERNLAETRMPVMDIEKEKISSLNLDSLLNLEIPTFSINAKSEN